LLIKFLKDEFDRLKIVDLKKDGVEKLEKKFIDVLITTKIVYEYFGVKRR
jgi:hypothetical protein